MSKKDVDARQLERVMALAGMYQATSLVQQVAKEGAVDTAAFEVTISSLFQINCETTEAVFGSWSHLHRGLKTLCLQLDRHRRDMDLTRYSVCLILLERKLQRRNDLMTTIRSGIESATGQVEFFDVTHSNVIANLAGIYRSTISQLSPRIMVTGTPAHLNNPENANKIRALLLAAIRSTVLWRRLGGNRLQLLVMSGRILALAQEVLLRLETEQLASGSDGNT